MIAIVLRDNGIAFTVLGAELVTLRDERTTPQPPPMVAEAVRAVGKAKTLFDLLKAVR